MVFFYHYGDFLGVLLVSVGPCGATSIVFCSAYNIDPENVIKAIEEAKQMGITIVSFTGDKKSKMNTMSDVCICAPSNETNHIQEMHITVGQLICGITENTLFGNKT